jgi:ankyrin repeat protein
LLDHGADPSLRTKSGQTTVQMAARAGRGDVLALVVERGFDVSLEGLDALLAACARDDASAVRDAATPANLDALRADGARALAEFAVGGNTRGLEHLLDLCPGLSVDTRCAGDPYWDIAPDSTPLQVAAWLAHHDTVRMLTGRGADVNAHDARQQTPLQLAVRAAVDSYWTGRRAADSVQALLEAGASTEGVARPCGYAPIDALLA